MKHFNAPWGWGLWLTSILATATLLAVPIVAGLSMAREGAKGPAWLVLVVPPAILVGTALFMVRGYTVAPGSLFVHRLFWATRLPLAGLQSATFEPNAMRCSLRTFGNGGLFAFCGWYRNRRLGSFRAYVTDLKRTVVLRYPTSTVVISPAAPERFILDVTTA